MSQWQLQAKIQIVGPAEAEAQQLKDVDVDMNVDVEVDVIVAPKLLPANPSNCANHFWQFSVPFLLAQKLKVFCDVIAFAPAVSLIKFKRLTKKKDAQSPAYEACII